MMRQGHMPGQSKTKSNALRLAAHERLEQSFTELRRRSWAGVGDLDDPSVTVVSQLERDGAARTGGFDGIEGKIEHRGAEAGLVGHRRRGWRASADPKGDPRMLTGRLKQGGDVVKQTNQVAGGMRPLFESTERQEAPNLLFHQRKLAQGHRHAGVSPRILATFQMKLNAQPGARQRVPELMSHPRRKLRQHVGALSTGGSSDSSAEAGRTSG